MKSELSLEDRKAVTDALAHVLADSYILQLKTQGFHWNVTGPHFYMLHKLFEEIYKDLADAIDNIAERMRSLGFLAPATFKEYQSLTSLKESEANLDAVDMVSHLCLDLECLARTSRKAHDISESVKDIVTQDLMIQRMDSNAKYAWMLRSHIE